VTQDFAERGRSLVAEPAVTTPGAPAQSPASTVPGPSTTDK
jgi:hypothetical protein